MLIEVAGGLTRTGMVKLEVTGLRLYYEELTVHATPHYPSGLETRDIASPLVLLRTAVHDGAVSLDLSVMHGIKKAAPRVTR
jgi:hypothetical protein